MYLYFVKMKGGGWGLKYSEIFSIYIACTHCWLVRVVSLNCSSVDCYCLEIYGDAVFRAPLDGQL